MLTLIKNIFLLSFIALVFSGCATLSKDECKTANWRTIGFGDGAKGEKASKISEHRSACAEYKITPDLNAYNAGRNEGLGQYCIPSTGYNKGAAGQRYNGICRNHNEKEFLSAFNHGLELHKQQSILNNLHRDYKKAKRKIKNANHQLSHNERRITSGKLTQLQAYKLLQENKEITKDISHNEHAMDSLQGDINAQTRRVNDLKESARF